MTAFWVVEPRRWRLRLIFWTKSSVFSRRCPPNKHYTTTTNRNGRSIWVSGYCRYCWSFVYYFLGLFYSALQWKNQSEGIGSAVAPGRYSTNIYTGSLRPEVQPLTLLYIIFFFEKRTSLVYLLLTIVPLSHTLFRTLTLHPFFTAVNALSFK